MQALFGLNLVEPGASACHAHRTVIAPIQPLSGHNQCLYRSGANIFSGHTDMTKTASDTVAHELSKVLADTYALYLKTHGYHWNVTGPQFNALHAMFMTQYTEMWTALDEIAERIRALGQLAPMSGSAFGNLSSIREGDPTLDAQAMLADLVDGQETLIATLKAARSVADEAGDDPTVDLLTQRLTLHQKTVWMLKATLG
jgi:starvation-inducible DNA-binding protein